MTVKDFAAATGLTAAQARKIAPTIPGAERDITRTIGGKHPWIFPENAPTLYAATPKETPGNFQQAPELNNPQPEHREAVKQRTPGLLDGIAALMIFCAIAGILKNQKRMEAQPQTSAPNSAEWQNF
jgi:hypothetical protein